MKESMQDFIREKVKAKDSNHYMMMIQKVKIFIDTNLSDMSSKNEEERLQGYFNALLRIRDLMQSEINDYALSQNINNLLDSYQKKKEAEERDIETFKKLTEDNDKKVITRKNVGDRPINYHKVRSEIESTTND